MSELAKALVAAQAAVLSVAKDAENTVQRYRYASSEAVIDEARRVLTANGLCVWLVGTEYQDTVVTNPGTRDRPETTQVAAWSMTCAYRLEHVSGEARDSRVVIPVIPGGGRPLDKAMMGARTSSLAYFLRDLLLMSRGEDNAIDQRDDRDYQPGPPAPKAEPKRERGDPLKAVAACGTMAQLANWSLDFDALKEAPTPTLLATFDARAQAVCQSAATLDEARALVKDVPTTNEPWRKCLIDAYQERCAQLRTGGAK